VKGIYTTAESDTIVDVPITSRNLSPVLMKCARKYTAARVVSTFTLSSNTMEATKLTERRLPDP